MNPNNRKIRYPRITNANKILKTSLMASTHSGNPVSKGTCNKRKMVSGRFITDTRKS
jgi:hypothetical protein